MTIKSNTLTWFISLENLDFYLVASVPLLPCFNLTVVNLKVSTKSFRLGDNNLNAMNIIHVFYRKYECVG